MSTVPATRRRLSRKMLSYTHLAAAAPLGAAVYMPTDSAGPLHLIVQVAILPLVTASGLWMWLGPQVRRRRRAAVS
jgi:hypothetical protein